MVNYNPKVWFSIIFHAYSRHVMRTLRPVLIFMAIYSAACCYIILNLFKFDEKTFPSTVGMHSLLGVVLGLFLVFRTNSAYDRWWEGRKHWGSLVNNARNLAHKINAFIAKEDRTSREYFSYMISNFVVSVREQVRQGVNVAELEGPVDELSNAKHVPNKITSLLYERLNGMYKNGTMTGDQLFLVDKELKEFTDIQGATERIKNTPIPYSYSMYIKKFIFIYLITLPFGFVTLMEYITIPIVVITSFVILSVELIAEEIEDPFGRDINDLPTDELSGKIRENVREIILG